MQKRWVVKNQGDSELVKQLASELNINNILANLLVQRNIKSYKEAKSFFRPQITDLHDPFLMKDMDKAIKRIEQALLKKEKILIYGDYDVDGTTAVALVFSFFKKLFKNNIDYYIPDRYKEGYGISIASINFAEQNDFKLIISLDCGIKAIEQVKYAHSKKIDFIICDHHRPSDELPAAAAVLDAKRLDCNYPFKELSGCGVGFKLICAFAEKNKIPFSEAEQYLDLVAISIASDVVPILGENRILAYYGLKLVNNVPRPGIEAILEFSNIKRKVDTAEIISKQSKTIFNRELSINDLVFLIGPRLNAAGRIENGKSSVELLISEKLSLAEELGLGINCSNNERRSLDTSITQHAINMIQEDSTLLNGKSTVIFHPDWHKGVVGIVASRLTESYYRPTIVLTQSNGLITGSARSIKDFDIYDAIDACSDLLEHFGGHKYAAGLSLKPENLDAFRKRFEEVVISTITEEMLTPEIEIDGLINLNEINTKFFDVLKQFAPFGPENMAPVFQTNTVVDKGYARMVGSNHLKLSVSQPGYTDKYFGAIAFQQGEHLQYISKKIPFNICYHIDENEWNGMTSLQLNVKDIKLQ